MVVLKSGEVFPRREIILRRPKPDDSFESGMLNNINVWMTAVMCDIVTIFKHFEQQFQRDDLRISHYMSLHVVIRLLSVMETQLYPGSFQEKIFEDEKASSVDNACQLDLMKKSENYSERKSKEMHTCHALFVQRHRLSTTL